MTTYFHNNLQCSCNAHAEAQDSKAKTFNAEILNSVPLAGNSEIGQPPLDSRPMHRSKTGPMMAVGGFRDRVVLSPISPLIVSAVVLSYSTPIAARRRPAGWLNP
jgi:hypothetical protein